MSKKEMEGKKPSNKEEAKKVSLTEKAAEVGKKAGKAALNVLGDAVNIIQVIAFISTPVLLGMVVLSLIGLISTPAMTLAIAAGIAFASYQACSLFKHFAPSQSLLPRVMKSAVDSFSAGKEYATEHRMSAAA